MGMNQPKNRPLERMFNDVPPTYDLMNKLLTFGLDRRWRKRAAELLLTHEPVSILDLCTGTGDFAIEIAGRSSTPTRMVALDFSKPMLELAEQKSVRKTSRAIEFIEGA